MTGYNNNAMGYPTQYNQMGMMTGQGYGGM
jgi:hypothetical protein